MGNLASHTQVGQPGLPGVNSALPDQTPFARRRWSKETYIAFLAAVAILVHLVFRFALHAPSEWCNIPLLVTLIVGGGPLVFDLLRRMAKLEFGSDLLAGMSIVVSVALGQYLAGSIVVLMLSG